MDTRTWNPSQGAGGAAGQARRLRQFSDAVLAQLERLAAQHEAEGAPPFAALVGPHLRHVIEHYEALLAGRGRGAVDYDRRARDRALEQSPRLARRRIAALRRALHDDAGGEPDEPLLVGTLGGIDGRWPLATASTFGRELVFLASHAVHHAALLREPCLRLGLALPPEFGVAPSTLAHRQAAH
jgi:hypothetical protein